MSDYSALEGPEVRGYSFLEVALPLAGFFLMFAALVFSRVAWSRSLQRKGRIDLIDQLVLSFKWPYNMQWVLFALGLFLFWLAGAF